MSFACGTFSWPLKLGQEAYALIALQICVVIYENDILGAAVLCVLC